MHSTEEMNRLLEKSGIHGSETAGQMAGYLALLKKWNSRINLTASTEWDAIEPMFREALWASSFYPREGISHLDIGSGAGFPALPIKILIPRVEVDLVESRERKSRFLETVADTLALQGVRVHNARLSDFLRRCGGERTWDCISWKGLKLSREDLELLKPHTHQRTQLWMFHGREAALQDSESITQHFQLLRSERVPGRREWNLSIYRPR